MKNNKITFPQFITMSFLSSLSLLLFIKNIPSLYLILCAVLSLAVNITVFTLYKGQADKFLIPVCGLFSAVYCTLIIVKFTDYMYRALSYGPMWLIMLVLLAFTYFCTVKGVEAVARASAVISVFVLAGIIYMFICSFSKIKFIFRPELPAEAVSAVILLLPSVLYVLFYDNIIKVKKSAYIIGSGVMLLVYVFFILIASDIISPYPVQHLPEISKIGVFKGADCILLAALTIAVIYSVTVFTTGLFRIFRHKYLTNALYIALLYIFSLSVIYFGIEDKLEVFVFTAFCLTLVLLIIIISILSRKRVYKNS